MIKKIKPIILSGGLGTRLWPLSRQSFQKQFGKIFENKSLFQEITFRFNSFKKLNFKQALILAKMI